MMRVTIKLSMVCTPLMIFIAVQHHPYIYNIVKYSIYLLFCKKCNDVSAWKIKNKLPLKEYIKYIQNNNLYEKILVSIQKLFIGFSNIHCSNLL